MSDLKEALDYIEGLHTDAGQPPTTEQRIIYAAARRLLEAEEEMRCETHGSHFLETNPDRYSMCLWMLYENKWDSLPAPDECRIVSKLLVDPQEGESE